MTKKRSELATLEDNITKLASEISALETRLNQQKTDLTTFENNKKKIASEISILEAKSNQHKMDLERLEAELAKAELTEKK